MFHSTNASYNTSEITSAVCGAGTYINLYANKNKNDKASVLFSNRNDKASVLFSNRNGKASMLFFNRNDKASVLFSNRNGNASVLFLITS
jgi:hypothetical protein